jgi:hypothetical protein
VSQNIVFTAGVTQGSPAVNVISSSKTPFDTGIVNVGILDGSAVNTAEDNGYHVYADFSNAAAGPIDIRINLTNNNASLPEENDVDWFLQPKQIVVVPPDTYTSLADADVGILGLAPDAYSYETQSHYFGNDLIVGPNSTVIPDSGSRPLNSTQGILSISGDIDVGGSGSFRGTVDVSGTDQHNVSTASSQGVSAYGRSLSRVSGLSASTVSASGYYDIAGVAVGVNNGYLGTYGITIQAGTRFRLFGRTTSGESHLVEGYASYSASVTTGAVFQNREGGLVVTKSHVNGRVIFSELYIRDDSGTAPPGGYPDYSYTAVFTVKIADGLTTLTLAEMTFELFDNGPNQAFTYELPATSDPQYHSPTYPDASNVTWWDYLGNSNTSNPIGLGPIRAQVDISFNGTMSVNELDRFVVDGSAEFVDISSARACIVDLSCVDTINGLSPALTAESTWTFNPSDATGNDRWYTIAECGTDLTPRVGQFTLLDKQGSRYHSVVLNAGFRTGGTVSANGIYLDAEASAWSTFPNYKGARIAYRASGSGCALQVQATNLPNAGTQYLFLSQNFGTDGWTITASGQVDGSANFPVLPDGSPATQAKSIALGNTQYDDTGESVTNLNSVFDGIVQVDGPRFNVTSGTSDFSGVDVNMYGGNLHIYDQTLEKSGAGNIEMSGPGDVQLTMSGGFERIPSNVGPGIGYTTISGGAVYVRGTEETTGVEALQLRSAVSSRVTSGGNMLIATNAEPGVTGTTNAHCRIHAAGDIQLYSGHESGQGRSLLGEVDISAAHRVFVAGHKAGGGSTTSSLQLGDPSGRFFTSVEEPFRLYGASYNDVSSAVYNVGSSARDGMLVFAPTTGPLVYMDDLLLQLRTSSLVSFVASLGARTHATSSNDTNQSVTLNSSSALYKPWAFHMVNQGVGPVGGSLSAHGTTRSMYPAFAYPYTQVRRATLYPFAAYANNPEVRLGNPGATGAATTAEVSFEIWVASTTNTYATDSVLTSGWFTSSWVRNSGLTPLGNSRVVENSPGQDASGWAYKICNNLRTVSNSSSLFNPWSSQSNTPSSAPVDLSFTPFTIPFEGRYVVQVIERIIEVSGSLATAGFVNFHGTSSLGYQEFHGGVNDSVPLQIDLHVENTYEQTQ